VAGRVPATPIIIAPPPYPPPHAGEGREGAFGGPLDKPGDDAGM